MGMVYRVALVGKGSGSYTVLSNGKICFFCFINLLRQLSLL